MCTSCGSCPPKHTHNGTTLDVMSYSHAAMPVLYAAMHRKPPGKNKEAHRCIWYNGITVVYTDAACLTSRLVAVKGQSAAWC